MTIWLSVIIRPQFALECLRQANQLAMGCFVAKFVEDQRGWPM